MSDSISMCKNDNVCSSSPTQFLPLLCSLYPLLHLHSKEPAVFTHLCWHPPLFELHSFTSVVRESNK